MDRLIQKLTDRYVLHTHPDVATTVEQSLIQLSSGIYTEDERFIFELLQNAVDAFNKTDTPLDIKIVIDGQYVIFMHNGDAFSERDIEGLCDIGNGNKVKDIKKIGYKGIGFKSVFMRSTCVTVKSGNCCFKFDKSFWDGYWEKHWVPTFGPKDAEKNYLMPWQIIPIKTNIPTTVDTVGYNVVTYIHIPDSSIIEQKINDLMSQSQFLLFLKARNIKISFIVNGLIRNTITKSTTKEQVFLSSNEKEDSRWLIYTNNEVEVPADLHNAINADTNTPQKLKDAKTFDLSFAIAIDNEGKLKRLPQKDAVIYAYLPTSFKFGTNGFPFLVNANFITDAGRLQLHKDSEWNKLIFSKIPSEFLSWIRDLSTTHRNYDEILPEKSYGQTNALEIVYATEMQKAIDSIAFIPQQNDTNKKILVSEAIIDKIRISETIDIENLIEHINRTYNRNSSLDVFTYPVKSTRVLADYGVFIIDKNKIKTLLEDPLLFNNELTVDYNIRLITFLYNFCTSHPKDADELISILSETKFLLNEDMELQSPESLFFYTDYKEENSLAENVSLLNEDVNIAIDNLNLTGWISKLGVKQLSNLSFIEFLYDNNDYITKENAIEIGRFIFHIYQTEKLFNEFSQYELKDIKFLTTKGNLKAANQLYLSEKYKPELNIESLLDEDIFISEEYCEDSSYAEWKIFLLKMGLKEDISNISDCIELTSDTYKDLFDRAFFDSIKEASERYSWVPYNGWGFNGDWSFIANKIHYNTFPFLDHCNNYNFSKLIFSRLLLNYDIEDIKTEVNYVKGKTGFIDRVLDKKEIANLCNINHLKWIIENCSILPTVKQNCRKAAEVYSNSIPQIKEIAGDYLPIIDIDGEIPESWQNYLGLKNHLILNDYLLLLTEIASDINNIDSNKDRIVCIYQKLVELGCLDSEQKRTQIKEWATQNKILSKDDIFMYPTELSHITIDGFSSTNRVYIGKCSNKEKVLELLALMGVTIITEDRISPNYIKKKEDDDLKCILRGKLSPLVLIAINGQLDRKMYDSKKNEIRQLLEHTLFYHCESINLTYGDDNDSITRTTYSSNNEFYYTGSLRPANIEPLLTPLCKYLGIKGKERELFILFIEDWEGIRQNLQDKGYNTDLLEKDPIAESGTIQTQLSYTPSVTEQERNLITGFKGEILVYEKLKNMGYNPKCPSISTKEDYDRKIEMNGKTYYCKINYNKYDISFSSNLGIKVYVEVKATTGGKEWQENMPISYNELSMIEECANNENERYLLARVFGIGQTVQEIYIFDAYLLDNMSLENIL